MTIDRRALVAVSLRRVPIAAIAGGGGVAAAVVVVGAAAAVATDDLLLVARLGAVVVAASTAGAVSDPTAPMTDATWRGRRHRTGLVLAPTLLLAAGAWTGAVIAAQQLVPGHRLPIGGLLVELVALTLVCWSITAALAESRGPRGAPVAGATCLMVLALVTMSMARTIEWLWRSPDPGWTASHVRWAAIGVAAFSALAGLWRDPAR